MASRGREGARCRCRARRSLVRSDRRLVARRAGSLLNCALVALVLASSSASALPAAPPAALSKTYEEDRLGAVLAGEHLKETAPGAAPITFIRVVRHDVF